MFHRLSLVPFLAWVGLGADGLSSSSYGPEEAYRTLGEHTYLAVPLVAMMAITVLVISRAYSRIIEEFPHGGGGYVVATKLLGERAGVVSGCALLVDYVLTITVSIAAAGEALFSFLPFDPGRKIWVEAGIIVLLTTLNIRGVRESVLVLLPIFLVFLVTHALLILSGIAVKLPEVGDTVQAIQGGYHGGLQSLGIGGMFLLFLHAYSLGSGTYTGIEAVSNGLPIMREPRVETGKRTMLYMAVSLAFTASGLLLCYLLWNLVTVPGKTMNAVLVERLVGNLPGGAAIVAVTLLSEGALLVVAAQAGFIDGPRVLANMAIDSWMPRRFAALSERLTTQNGIVLMGSAALAALAYTHGNVRQLVVMYSINVFLTFSLSTFAMLRSWYRNRGKRAEWKRRVALFAVAFSLCATILVITVVEKFPEGGWLTLGITAALVALCFLIRGHYRSVARKLQALYAQLEYLPDEAVPDPGPPDPQQRTAAVLVAGYGGVGIHTVLSILRQFPGDFKNLVFLSVGVIDSGSFKGEEEIELLKTGTEAMLERYLRLACSLGIAATFRYAIGTEVVEEAEKLSLQVAGEFPRTTFFIGKVIFRHEAWYHRLLHNETAFAIQKRLEWAGKPMVILPARVG
jgi:amino acid transporter